MDLSALTELEKDRLLELLREKDKDFTDNRLDFMEWHKYPEQHEIREYTLDRFRTKKGANTIVIFGGNRSGKSESGGGIVAEIFKTEARKRIWCATHSDMTVKVQQRKLHELIRKKDIMYGEYNPVRGWKNNTIISHNNTIIYFKTYEQGAQSFQGDDVDMVWLDEECPMDIYQEAMIRLGDRQGVMLLTFTCLMGFTKLVNKFWQSTDKTVKTTVLTPFKNPFLTQESKDQLLAGIDPDEVESRWEGKPSIASGLIYKGFGKTHQIERFDYRSMLLQNPNRYELHEGIDPHERTPHHWLMFLWDKHENIVYVVEELKAPIESMLVKDYSRLIHYKRQKLVPAFCQIDTSSQKPDVITRHPDEDQENVHTVRMEFMRCGIQTILCTKDNNIGINAVKERLKVVKTRNGDIKRMPTLYVFNDLKGVIWEFSRYSWDSYATAKMEEKNELVNKVKKKDDHFMDIIKYECIKVKSDPIEDEIYIERTIYDGMGY